MMNKRRLERLFVRMTSAELKAVDRIAEFKKSNRSQVIRNLVATELKKVEKKTK